MNFTHRREWRMTAKIWENCRKVTVCHDVNKHPPLPPKKERTEGVGWTQTPWPRAGDTPRWVSVPWRASPAAPRLSQGQGSLLSSPRHLPSLGQIAASPWQWEATLRPPLCSALKFVLQPKFLYLPCEKIQGFLVTTANT